MDENSNRNFIRAQKIVRTAAAREATILNLEGLGLTSQQFEQLLPEIIPMWHLYSLSLGNNQLESIPPEIGNLRRLQTLDLSGNRLNSLPQELANLSQLNHIDLSKNRFDSIPQSLTQLANLRVLYLISNNIQIVPNELTNLNNLTRLGLENNPLSLETLNWLNRNFQGRVRTNMAAHDLRNNPYEVLKKIYGPNINPQLTAIRDLNLGRFTVGEADSRQESFTAVQVLGEFLSKVPVGGVNSEKVYLPVTEYLLEKILDNNLSNVERQEYLGNMATSLGDCATPVKAFMGQVFISIEREKGATLSEDAHNILKVMSVEHEILVKLKKYIPENEEIEQVQGLVNAIFLEGSETAPTNQAPISGDRLRLPSQSVYDTFLFVSAPAAEAFAKLVCEQENDGALRKNEAGQYLLEPNKLRGITEKFLAKQGFLSPRELQINNYVKEMKKHINENAPELLGEHIGKPGVDSIIDVEGAQREVLRAKLLDVPDDQVATTTVIQEYLEQQERAVAFLSEIYTEVPKPDMSRLGKTTKLATSNTSFSKDKIATTPSKTKKNDRRNSF